MPRASRARALGLTLLLIGAAPAMAVPARLPSATSPVGEEAVRAALVEALAAGRGGDCKAVLARLDPLVPTLSPGPSRNAVQLLRMNCLASSGRADEIAAVHRELAAADPDNPVVRGYGVMVAAAADDMKTAGDRLATLAERMPAGLAGLGGTLWRAIDQRLGEQRDTALRDRLAIALARADWQPADQPTLRAVLAQSAIRGLLRRGEAAEAELLLARVDLPETLFAMATERHFAPLWPQVERLLGPGSGDAVDRFAARALATFATIPDDLRARRDAVGAFLLLGRYAETSETAAPVRVAAGMGEDAVAIVRLDAQALAAAGRHDAALDRLRPFATLDPARDPVAVSGVLALAEMLDERRRPDEALAVARAGLTRGQGALSPWGANWLRRTEVCALAALGRATEAVAAAAALRARAAGNEAAAIEASLCAGEQDSAARLAVATLATPDGADRIADQFQPEAALWAPTGSRLRALWTAFLARPDVKAAFDRAARIFPQPLWPARTPRPIPRAANAGPTA